VRDAADRGALDEGRLANYQRLQDELAVLTQQQGERAQREARRRAKIDSKALNKHLKTKRG
jgi:hypothetical protein